MKTYNEMADDVFARRDVYVEHKKTQHKRIATAAGCLCLAAVLGVGVGHMYADTDKSPDNDGVYVMEHVLPSTPTDLSADKKAAVGRTEDLADSAAVSAQPSPDFGEDIPADPDGVYVETVDVGGGDWYGGRYVDENSHVVILLTSATPENIALARQFDPSIPADAIFKTANYSLRDLNDIQGRISYAMLSGELPFVVKSALMEAQNVVQVTVVSPTDAELELIRSYDTLDGAVEIVYGVGAVSEMTARVEPIYEDVTPAGANG